MNLAESMKHVLKNKSQSILKALITEDFRGILKGFLGDILPQKLKKPDKNFQIKQSFSNFKDSVQDTALIFKEIPHRLNNGFKIFHDELKEELEKLPDHKQKTKFCMKVLAGLSKFALSSAYGVGVGDVKLLGLGRSKRAITHMMAGKLMFRTMQALIIRFIMEVEKEITDPLELKNLQHFKEIVLDDRGNAIDKFFDGVTDPEDRAFAIVENFKNYIFTGEIGND